MIVVKIFVWYFAVIFCYARNIFLWKGQLGILLVVLVFSSSIISVIHYMCVHDKHLGSFKKILTISFEIFITAINNIFRYHKFRCVSLWTRNY